LIFFLSEKQHKKKTNMATGDVPFYFVQPQVASMYMHQQVGPLEVDAFNGTTALTARGDIMLSDGKQILSDTEFGKCSLVFHGADFSQTFGITSTSMTALQMNCSTVLFQGGATFANIGSATNILKEGEGLPFFTSIPESGTLPTGTVYVTPMMNQAGEHFNCLAIA
jgi:hypothetical protein